MDAPYKPITDHGTGKRMGGGKGSIDEYGTPVRLIFGHFFSSPKSSKVKAGKVVVEVGGLAEWEEVHNFTKTVKCQYF